MPEHIGLFPLELVLLPTERIPLHIFEPRYKELIRECLDEDREFGLVLADEDGRRDVGTRAAVVQVLQTFDDGRLNIVVEGRERFRILAETEGRSFRTGEIETVEDELDRPTDEEVERALGLFDRLVDAAAAGHVGRPDPGSESTSFELAAWVDFGPAEKQALLELVSERERLRRVCELFELAAEGLAMEKAIRERASGNGKPPLRRDQSTS